MYRRNSGDPTILRRNARLVRCKAKSSFTVVWLLVLAVGCCNGDRDLRKYLLKYLCDSEHLAGCRSHGV